MRPSSRRELVLILVLLGLTMIVPFLFLKPGITGYAVYDETISVKETATVDLLRLFSLENDTDVSFMVIDVEGVLTRLEENTLFIEPETPGEYEIRVFARMGDEEKEETIRLDVVPVWENRPPAQRFALPNMTIADAVNVSEFFSDPDNDTLQYRVKEQPYVRMKQKGDMLTFSDTGYPGEYELFLYVSDGADEIQSSPFFVSVEGKPEFTAKVREKVFAGSPVEWVDVKEDKDAKEGRISFIAFPSIEDLAIVDEEGQQVSGISQENDTYSFPANAIEKKQKTYTITYKTHSPTITEQQINPAKKRVKVSSDIHYENITVRSIITPAPEQAIRLYWIKGKRKEAFPIDRFIDGDGDGNIDVIEWTVPHLSEQEFEIEITILNVQSYPMVGGNWTVRFNTTGTADLVIAAVNGTTYNSTPNDLTPLELSCNGTLLPFTWASDDAVMYAEYSCDNATGKWTVGVNTAGVHNQGFTFQGQTVFAHNDAGNCTPDGNDWYINTSTECSNMDIIARNLYVSPESNGTRLRLVNVNVTFFNSTVNGGLDLINSTAWVNGNMTANSAGYVNLSNATVRMNGTCDGCVGMNVTGTLIINSSNVTNGISSTSYYYLITEPESTLTIKDSYAEQAGWASTSCDTYGFCIRGNSSLVQNSTFQDNYYFVFQGANKTVLVNNTITNTRGNHLVDFTSSNNNTIRENYLYSEDGMSVLLSFATSSNNLIMGNTISTPLFGRALYAAYLSNSQIIQNNLSVNLAVYPTLVLAYSSGNEFSQNYIENVQGNSTSINQGSGNLFVDNEYRSGSYDFHSDAWETNTLIRVVNYTTPSKIDLAGNYSLIIQNYLDVYVNDSEGALSGVNVSVRNQTWEEVNWTLTNTSGLIERWNLTAYFINGTDDSITDYNNYTVMANKTGYQTQNISINISTSVQLNITLEDDIYSITDCTDITQSGVYSLVSDITPENDNFKSSCINITAENVTLDCNGYTIEGDDTEDYGIYSYPTIQKWMNTTIRNCNVSKWDGAGIYLRNSNNDTIVNVIGYGTDVSKATGVILWDSDNAYINNISTTGRYRGFYSYFSEYIILNNSVFQSNGYFGIQNRYSIITIENTLVSDTANRDISMSDSCNTDENELINITGTGGKPILFYDTDGNTISNTDNLSQLILCGADNTRVENVTLISNGIDLFSSNSCNISNVTIIGDTRDGLGCEDSDNNWIENSSFVDQSISGVNFDYCDNNTVINNRISDGGYGGISIRGNQNTIKENTFFDLSQTNIPIYINGNDNLVLRNSIDSPEGDGIWVGGDRNNITQNNVSGANLAGVVIKSGKVNNSIFNNLFNNTRNVVFEGTIYNNSFNTSQQAGTRVFSPGTLIGGNFWANYSDPGNGFSETCQDSDRDGFCNAYYNVLNDSSCYDDCGNNTDYFPYSDEYGSTTLTDCTDLNESGVYTLGGDITPASYNFKSYCINITAENVTLDCNGYTIEGDDTEDYGIYSYPTSQKWMNTTIKNCNVSEWDTAGVYLRNSNNNTIFDSNVSDNAEYGIHLENCDYSLLDNLTVKDNGDRGLYNYFSDYNVLNNSWFDSNIGYGVYSRYSIITIENTVLENNDARDLFMGNSCGTDENEIINVTGTGGKPILFYDTDGNDIRDTDNLSQLILCGADYTVVDNVSLTANGVDLIDADYCNLSNVSIVSSARTGLLFTSGGNNLILNSTFYGQSLANIYNQYSSNNSFVNLTLGGSSYRGIVLGGDGHLLDGLFFYDLSTCDMAVLIEDDNVTVRNSIISGAENYAIAIAGDDNNITNNTIIGSGTSGILMDNAGIDSGNVIYNNLFNNTRNVVFVGTVYNNSFNTSQQTGNRIFSPGVQIGGNFWANYSSPGTGFSENCTDSNKDGFCDLYYNVMNNSACSDCLNNTDFLPLSGQFNGTPVVSSLDLTPTIAFTNDSLHCTFNITDQDTSFLNVTVSWFRDSAYLLNQSINYTQGTSYSANLTDNYTYNSKEYYCNITATDGVYSIDPNVSSTITVQNYTTSLAVENSTDAPTVNTQFQVFANYTANDKRSSGRGLVNYEIAPIIWNNTANQTFSSAAFIDYYNDGSPNEVLFGHDGTTGADLYLFDAGGSHIWALNTGYAVDVEVYDLDDDSFVDDILLTRGSSGIARYNTDGSVNWTGVDSSRFMVTADLFGTGELMVIVGGSENTPVFIYYMNGTQFANESVSGSVRELVAVDVDLDGIKEIVYAINTGPMTIYNVSSKSRVYNSTVENYYAVGTLDLDNDGFLTDIVGDNVLDIEIFNRTLGKMTGSPIAKPVAGTSILSLDADSDSFVDDIAFVSSNVFYIYNLTASGNTVSYDQICNVSAGVRPYSINLEDVDGDGVEEIVFAGDSDALLMAVDTSCNVVFLHNYSSNLAGTYYDLSKGLAFGDVNEDGIMDIATGSAANKSIIFQQVGCTAIFSDSTSYNMTWDESLNRWYVNKTFSSAGDYSYNVTCEKGGYETQFETSSITVDDNPPILQSINISPTIAFTNDSLHCTFNITDQDTSVLNVTVSWFRDSAYLLNQSINYTQGTSYSANLTDNYTYNSKSYYCNITATDGVYSIGPNVSSTITIQNYTTSLAVENSTDSPGMGEVMGFFVNYSSAKSGDLGRTLYTEDLSIRVLSSVVSVDFDRDGVKDDVVAVEYYSSSSEGDLYAFNGSVGSGRVRSAWNTSGLYYPRDAVAVDYDQDGYYEGVFIPDLFPLVVNETGGALPGVSLESSCMVALGNDGSEDIVFYSASGVVGASMANGTKLWNNSFEVNSSILIREMHAFDADGDGYRDEVILYHTAECSHGLIEVFNSSGNQTGELLFTHAGCGGEVFGMAVGDVDNDGFDEFVVQEMEGLYPLMFFDRNLNNYYNFTGNYTTNTFDMVFADLDDDGWRDDLLIGDAYGVKALRDGNASLWNVTSLNRIHSIHLADVNDDGSEEVVAFSQNNAVYVLNASDGFVLLNYSTEGNTGDTVAHSNDVSALLDHGDVNNDGIQDIIIGDNTARVYMVQDANCSIVFNDSTSGDMTWNYSNYRWEYDRSFSSLGEYSYNITCEKGGYESQFLESSITVSNSVPTIPSVTVPSSLTPIEGSTAVLTVNFTVDDAEGNATINASTASAFTNFSDTIHYNTSCDAIDINATAVNISCNISMQYYDLPGIWSINVSINDTSGASVSANVSFNYDSLVAIALNASSLDLGTLSIGSSSVAGPIVVNNTGNVNISYLLLKAFDLVNESYVIGAGNFSVNISSSATGQALLNDTNVNITSSPVNISTNTSIGNQTIYIIASITQSTPALWYSSLSDWIVEVGG